MSKKYSGRIHDPNHNLSDYDIYFNDDNITDGGMYTLDEIAAVYGTGTASGNPAVITDSGPFAPTELTAVYPVKITNGSLIPFGLYESDTINDVTITVNTDGSITADGTASAAVSLVLFSDAAYSYTYNTNLNGCPAGGGSSTFDLRVSVIKPDETTTYLIDTGSGKQIPAGYVITRLVLLIRAGTTVSNLTFYPMITVDGAAQPAFRLSKIDTYEESNYVILNDGYNTVESADGSIVSLTYVKH